MTDGISNSGLPPSSPDWEALARHLSGESSPEEAERIQAMLAVRPEDRELLEGLDRMISGISPNAPEDLDVEAALQKVKARRELAPSLRLEPRDASAIPVSPPVRWRVPMTAVAAVALLAVGVASWLTYRNRPREQAVVPPTSRMIATGVGVRDSMRLADGSKVVIGPLSSVIIATGYGADAREVEVRGNAWFDVVHDERRPFTVKAGNAAIVDLGTQFAVQSDAPAGVLVTVSKGSVSLRQMNTPVTQGVILKAGDNGILKSGGQVETRRGSASEDDFAWRSGRLVFRDASMDEVIASMRKWYGIELRVNDRSLVTRHLTATFADESPGRVLEVIRLALGAEIDRRGDTAIVRPSKGSVRSR
ncbi:MAG: FecR domain-containing protein [Gemmatimonadales bacterium]